MIKRAYQESNPLMAVTGGLAKAGGAAVNAAGSYRCVTCGSKPGAKPTGQASAHTASSAAGASPQPADAGPPPPSAAPAGWHTDPWDGSQWRWWDGAQWTHHTNAGAPNPVLGATRTPADHASASAASNANSDNGATGPVAASANTHGIASVAEAQRLTQEGDAIGAERLLREAVDSDDPSAAAVAAVELGNLLMGQGQEGQAIAWWEIALASAYSLPGSLAGYNLGVAYERRGEIEKAKSAFAASVDLGAQIAESASKLGQENPAEAAQRRLAGLLQRNPA